MIGSNWLKPVFHFCLLTCLFSSVYAQTTSYLNQLDLQYQKLLVKYRESPNETLSFLVANPPKDHNNLIRAQYYLVLSEAYYGLTYPDKAVDHAQYGINLVDESSQPWLFHKLQLAMAMALDIQGNLKTAESRTTRAIEWAESVSDKEMIINGLFYRGVIKTTLVDYLGALQDLQRAYNLAPKNYQTDYQLDPTKGDVSSSLALLYEYRNEDDLAIPFYQESVTHCREKGDELQLSISLYGLGRANISIGNKEKGKAQLQEALQLSDKLNDIQGVAYALRALASVELRDNNLQAAESMNKRAFNIFQSANNAYMLLDTSRHLAIIALKTKQIDNAYQYLKLARSHLKADSMTFQKLSLEILESQILAANGEHEKAYKLLLQSEQAKEKLLEKQSSEQLHRLRTQYELDVKENENILLEKANQLQQITLNASQKQNNFLSLITGSLGFIIFLVLIIFYRDNKHKQHLQRLATTDSLTGLNNRRRALEILDEQIAACQRFELDLCVAIIDLDHFKSINDTYGHNIGDKVLQEFARFCNQSLRRTDVIGRIGGEEFMVILPDTNIKGATHAMEKLRQTICGPIPSLNLDDLTISVSIGLGQFKNKKETEDFIKQVDSALYQAKNKGRNQVVVINS